jgi:hypothetical protein
MSIHTLHQAFSFANTRGLRIATIAMPPATASNAQTNECQ